MPRPPKPRRVGFLPPVTFFNPVKNLPAGDLVQNNGAEIILNLDEWEALRLKDFLGLNQAECAGYMGLAQSSFQRILAAARNKLASAVVEGKPVHIQSRDYQFTGHLSCNICGHQWETCVGPEIKGCRRCPSCGTKQVDPHHLGYSSRPQIGHGRRKRRRGNK